MRERGEPFQYRVPEFSVTLELKEKKQNIVSLLPEKQAEPVTRAEKSRRNLQNLTRRVAKVQKAIISIKTAEKPLDVPQEEPESVGLKNNCWIELDGPEVKYFNDEDIWSDLDGKPKKKYLPRYYSQTTKHQTIE